MTRPHTGRWFEELTPGTVIEHAIRRTITESDNVMFTSMTMNPAWLHLDFDYAANETEFGQPLVNSMLTIAMVIFVCGNKSYRKQEPAGVPAIVA